MNIVISKALLLSLISMAQAHVNDVRSSFDDGECLGEGDVNLPDMESDIETAEAIIASAEKADGASSIKVQCFASYGPEVNGASKKEMTHQMDLYDIRQGGQVRVVTGSLEGDIDLNMMDILHEVAPSPVNQDDHVPAARIHFDGDNLALSVYKIGSRILIHPERGVHVEGDMIEVGSEKTRELVHWFC